MASEPSVPSLDELEKGADFIAVVASAPLPADRTEADVAALMAAIEAFAEWLQSYGVSIVTSIGQNGMIEHEVHIDWEG